MCVCGGDGRPAGVLAWSMLIRSFVSSGHIRKLVSVEENKDRRGRNNKRRQRKRKKIKKGENDALKPGGRREGRGR